MSVALAGNQATLVHEILRTWTFVGRDSEDQREGESAGLVE